VYRCACRKRPRAARPPGSYRSDNNAFEDMKGVRF
jgi:hypothetical protein